MSKHLNQIEVASRLVALDREESEMFRRIRDEKDRTRELCTHENPGGEPIRSRYGDSTLCGVCGAVLRKEKP